MSWSDLDYTRPRPRLLARGVPERLVPPAEPPLANLVAESRRRDLRARDAAADLAEAEMAHWRETDDWKDPYGPDRIVFGSVPRVKDPLRD